jgi:hypothetical protein
MHDGVIYFAILVGISILTVYTYRKEISQGWSFVLVSARGKVAIIVLVVWTFLNSYVFLRASLLQSQYGIPDKVMLYQTFHPIDGWDSEYYDVTEYFVYVIGAWMIFFLSRYMIRK